MIPWSSAPFCSSEFNKYNNSISAYYLNNTALRTSLQDLHKETHNRCNKTFICFASASETFSYLIHLKFIAQF